MSLQCPFCLAVKISADSRINIISFGSFIRKNDRKSFQRYFCKTCQKHFSEATFEKCYKQKKRYLNPLIFQFLASCITQRRCALLLRINRKTVIRKFIFIGQHGISLLQESNLLEPKVECMEFDDLETSEHTKLKPLSVTLAVESKTRRILGFRVARMPAKGLLVKKSLKKYGPRVDERKLKRCELFNDIAPMISETAEIKSDMNPHYGADVKKYFPKSNHLVFKGRRGCVVGQGELKAGGFDPLFSLNHTCAMLRANISRLVRRTWSTTKLAERLNLHLGLYAIYHNFVLLKKTKAKRCSQNFGRQGLI